MKNGYYITKSGEKVTLEATDTIDVSNKNIIELVLPEGIQYVSCENNQLKELVLPEGVKTVFCENNQLKELVLPEGIQYVSCDDLLFDIEKYLNKKVNINIVCK